MPQLVKKRRSGWAVLAVCALVASILAVGAGPVSGQQPIGRDATSNHNPDWGAHWSACVGSAGTHDAMFSDVSGHALAGDINCIAYYGITIGMGDGTYAPEANVTAFEMRLFVERAADLMGADGAAVLGDVMLSDTVTRLEMAQLMFGLVNDINGALRYNPSNNDIENDVNGNGVWERSEVVNDYFADARASVPNAESQLVGATYELGITRGTRMDGTRISTPDSTFSPFANVTRAEMAAFIARTLDHSNLRPNGLSMQRNNNGETQVSLRGDDGQPIENEPIDVFSALYPDAAFDDDGECVLRFVKDETPSFDACAIDIGDQLTDDGGNVEFELTSDRDPITVTCGTGVFSLASGSEATTFWAWTGAQGDQVGDDTDLAELENVARPVGRAGPDYLRLSGGLPTGDELAKMGEQVTFTAQLYADTGTRDGATLDNDVAVGPDRTGNIYLLQIERYLLTRVEGTDSDWGDMADQGATPARNKTGNASIAGAYFADNPGDWNYGTLSVAGINAAATDTQLAQARFGAAYQTPVFPNADGMFPITLDNPDYNAASNDTDVGVRFVLRRLTPGNDLADENPLDDIVENSGTHTVTVTPAVSPLPYAGDDVAVGTVIFSDDGSDTHSVSGTSSAYQIIGGSRTPNVVTVKVVDQYGDPQRGVDITVLSSLDMAATADDEVLYPEQVDITVGARENGDGDRGSAGNYNATDDPFPGEVGEVNPTTAVTSLTVAARAAANVTPTPTEAGPFVLAALRVTDVAGTVDEVPQDDVIGTFKTRRDGTYRIGYGYTGDEAQTETITPSSARIVRLGVQEGANTVEFRAADNTDAADIGAATVTHAELGSGVSVYWTKIGTSGRSDDPNVTNAANLAEFLAVYAADAGRRTIVANEITATDTDEPKAYFYDDDEGGEDVFIIEGTPVTIEKFDEALGLSVNNDGCKVTTVSWDNYTYWRDPDRFGGRPGRVGRTIWEITIGT